MLIPASGPNLLLKCLSVLVLVFVLVPAPELSSFIPSGETGTSSGIFYIIILWIAHFPSLSVHLMHSLHMLIQGGTVPTKVTDLLFFFD